MKIRGRRMRRRVWMKMVIMPAMLMFEMEMILVFVMSIMIMMIG